MDLEDPGVRFSFYSTPWNQRYLQGSALLKIMVTRKICRGPESARKGGVTRGRPSLRTGGYGLVGGIDEPSVQNFVGRFTVSRKYYHARPKRQPAHNGGNRPGRRYL